MTSLTIAQLAPRVMVHLADAAMRSIALACLAVLLLAAFRVRHVSTQLAVWTGVLYAALAMPLLVWLLPAIPVHLRIPAKQVMAAAPISGGGQLDEPDKTALFERVERSGRFQRAGRTLRAFRAVSVSMNTVRNWRAAGAASSVSAGKGSGQKTGARAQLEWQGDASARLLQTVSWLGHESRPALTWLPRPAPSAVLLAVYLLGVMFLLGRLVVGLVLSLRLRRSSTRVDDSRALRWLEWHAVAMGPRRTPVLAESSAVSVPLTLGLLRPLIVIPSDWREWPSAKLAAVIAHEVSHVKRNDSRTKALALIYRCFFWFSPLGWWLERRLADLAEQASDQAAVRAGTEPIYYAEVLMSFFDISTTQGRVSWQGISMARGVRARNRIERVLSLGKVLPAGIKAPIAILLTLCALPVVCLTAATRPVLVAAAASALSDSPPQAVARLQLPEPPPPAAPAPPAFAYTAPAAPVAQVAPLAPPAPAAPDFSYAITLVPAAPAAPIAAVAAPRAIPGPAPTAPVAPASPQAAPTPSAAPPAPEAPPVPAGPDSAVARAYEQLRIAARVNAVAASTQYRELLTEARAAYAQAAKAYRYAYSQAGGTTVTNSEDDDENWTLGTPSEGMDFAIASGKSVMMFGSEDDRDEVKSLQRKISGDFIWFIHSGNAYVIRDAATVQSAKALFAPIEELGRKQEELGKQQKSSAGSKRPWVSSRNQFA